MFKYLLLCILILAFTSLSPHKTYQTIFETEHLKVVQISKSAFQHISYLQTENFGKVACNGLVISSQEECLILDTPTEKNAAMELIKWLEENKKLKIKAIIPTHFHEDCLGSLATFHEKKIPSFGSKKTIELAQKNKSAFPKNTFKNFLVIDFGNKKLELKYFGEGHTVDNIVAYCAADRILFGGCLIKEIGASKGFLGDANLKEWSNTVKKVRLTYPKLKTVVPGHGSVGDRGLLDYTIKLFEPQN
jgi:metallo-beta-lactamase class B